MTGRSYGKVRALTIMGRLMCPTAKILLSRYEKTILRRSEAVRRASDSVENRRAFVDALSLAETIRQVSKGAYDALAEHLEAHACQRN